MNLSISVLTVIWVLLSCIDTHNKRIWQAAMRGELPDGDEEPPSWLSLIQFPKYGVLLYISYLDWRHAFWLWVLTFACARYLSLLMEMIGAVLLIPLRVTQVLLRKRAR